MDTRHLSRDMEIVERCIARDGAAWEEFVTRFTPLIRTAIERRLKRHTIPFSSQDVEDIHQEILTSLWNSEKLKSITEPRDIVPWLAVVSGNAAISYIRAKFRGKKVRVVPLDALADKDEAAAATPAGSDELRDAMRRAVDHLPPKERLVMKLNLFHEHRYDEIAEILHMPAGTVASHIARARKRIRGHLEDFLQ